MLKPPYTKYDRLYVYHLDRGAKLPTISDPDLIGTWLEDDSPILFFHKPKDELVADLCSQHGCTVSYQADLDYTDWEAGHLIEPFTVGGISVSPLWCGKDSDIRLDPSVIFGSGFHPSTRLCLETMIKYCRTPELEMDSMLDLGTGTGLLAIAAARLGLGHVTAVDNNPLACEVASRNINLNCVNNVVGVTTTDLRKKLPDTHVDLVVANLYHKLLADLFENPSFWQAKLYIVSGFVSSMEAELLAALPARKVRMLERCSSDRWCLWVLAPI